MSREAVEVQLRDGRRVVLRLLEPTDREDYAEAVASLSPDSRYLRFFSAKPGLTDGELDHLTILDGYQHVAFVAVQKDPPRGIGASRYERLADQPDVAEVGIAVGEAWRGLGVGRLLLGRLIEHGAAAGLAALVGMTLAENRPAAALLRAVGFELTERDGIYRHYRLELPSPPR